MNRSICIFDKVLVAGCLLVSGMSVWGDSLGVFQDGVLTYDLSSAASETASFASYGAVTKVVKKGDGTLTLKASNAGYAGTVELEAGIMVDDAPLNGEFCTGIGSAASVTVKSGAQFKNGKTFGWNAQGTLRYSSTFSIEGEGPDGNGAISFVGAGPGDRMFSKIVMTGPATIGGGGRGCFGGGTFNMNGFTFTNKCAALWTGVTLVNPGDVVHLGDNFTFEGNASDLKPSTEGGQQMFYVKDGGQFGFWAYTSTASYQACLLGSASIGEGSGNYAWNSNNNNWQGPISIPANGWLSLKNTSTSQDGTIGLKGPISGEGGISVATCTKGFKGYLRAANSYTGGTKVSGSELWGVADRSIPPHNVQLTGGRLVFLVGETGSWDFANIHEVCEAVTVKSGGAFTIQTGAGRTVTDPYDWTGVNPVIGHAGTGTLVLSGAVGSETANAWFQNFEGTLKFTNCGNGAWNYLASLAADKDTILFEDAGNFWTGRNSLKFGSAQTPRLVVKGHSVLAGSVPDGTANSPSSPFYLGGSSAGLRAILEVAEGAGVTNKLFVGNTAKSVGAVYLSGEGSGLHMTCQAWNDSYIGASGYGTVLVKGGVFGVGHAAKLGAAGDGTGILDLRAGRVEKLGSLNLSGGGTGVVYQTGGVFKSKSATYTLGMGALDWADSATRAGRGIYTVDGPDALVDLDVGTVLGQRTNNFVGVVNLNRGVYASKRFAKNNWSSQYQVTLDLVKTYGYVNFNGGTYRFNEDAFAAADVLKPNKVTVFAGGATLDVNGRAGASVGVPLEAPEGYGVKSIAFPNATCCTNYIGSQLVSIAGGSCGMTEASAIALVDEAQAKLTNIVMMSSGQGYQPGDVVTATIPNAYYTGANPDALVVTLTDVPLASGGLTVTNSASTAGTLTLAAVNTYTGATVVAAGTLKLGVENAIAASRGAFVSPGAVLDLNGKGALSVDELGGGGQIQGGDVTAANLVFPAATATNSTLTLTGSLTLGASAKLRVTGVAANFPQKSCTLVTAANGITCGSLELAGFEETEHPQLWKLVKSSNSIKLAYARGTLLVFR